ncbi:MAG: aminotransferase class V-fold PLP-dependent enzyme, partial [Actinobacteria bacterium]
AGPRHRDRRDRRIPADEQRQRARRVRHQPGDRRCDRGGAPSLRRPAERRRRRGGPRPERHHAAVRDLPIGREDHPAGRRGRGDQARPRRQRSAVGARGRGRRRDRPVGGRERGGRDPGPRVVRGVLSERTKVVAFTLASNAVGTVTPAAELTRLVHERTPAIVACDGVHLAQHRRIDVRAIGADLVACSPYKIFGPHLGILFGRREVLSSLRPYKVRPADDALPFAFETGTQNHEGFAGWVAAVGYLAGLGRGNGRRAAVADAFERAIVPWEAGLSERFLDGVRAIASVRLYGIDDTARIAERTPTFAIRVGDQHPAETAKALAERGVFVWDGNYYALEIMERLGLQASGGAVRIGFCHYNTPDEVDRVLEELAALA